VTVFRYPLERALADAQRSTDIAARVLAASRTRSEAARRAATAILESTRTARVTVPSTARSLADLDGWSVAQRQRASAARERTMRLDEYVRADDAIFARTRRRLGGLVRHRARALERHALLEERRDEREIDEANAARVASFARDAEDA
jgi:hypothetical protein